MARHTACAIDDKCDAEWIGEGVSKLWGPLPLESTAKFGAHAPVCSFVVRPVLDADLVAEVMAEVGGDAIPARDETHARLRQRLKQSTSLDNPRIVVCKRGRHGYFKHQNDIQAREGAQSRRATYGDPVQPTLNDEAGRAMVRMRGYMHLYRHREDMRMCRPMPASLRALRDALYSQVWGYFSWPVCCAPCVPGSCCHGSDSLCPQVKPALSEKSKSLGAPTSCDALFYYGALKTKTGRHRDAFESWELDEYYKMGCNPFARNTYAQNKGTDVLIFTLGNAEMEMGLSFPKTKLDALDREHYEQPPGLCIPLTPGTLLVYSPLDDLFFCHEVAFPRNTTSGNATSCSPSAYRMAFVFRWLNECAERLYYLDPAYQGRHVPP